MLPPGLSMLWESTDAPTAFRERFGFADYSAGVAWLVATLSREWGVVVESCERIVISDQNAIAWVATADSPQPLICKWSRTEAQFAKLAAVAEVITELAAQGIPVAAPILSLSGEGREVVAGANGPWSVAVQPVIGGRAST
ncbi:MAG: aminoglycoside phosphotransferase [Frondihabitans sp.]|nr:aminoglycoside phosphotransferase [Frondihabitans sp.]